MNEQPGWHKHKLATAAETELDHRHVRATNTVQRGRPVVKEVPGEIWLRSSTDLPWNLARHLTWHQLESPSSWRRSWLHSGEIPEVPDIHTHRRSSWISFFLGKRISLPSLKVPTKKDIFNTCSVLCTHTSTPVWYTQNIECNSGEGELDTRDLEMSQF